MGIYCVYRECPSRVPDGDTQVKVTTFPEHERPAPRPSRVFGREVEDLMDNNINADFDPSNPMPTPANPIANFFLFLHSSVFRLMWWLYSSTHLTLAHLDRLVHNVLLADNFDIEAYRNFSADKEVKRLDRAESSPLRTAAGWTKSKVTLSLPCAGRSYHSEAEAPQYVVNGVYHRDLVDIMTSSSTTIFMDSKSSGLRQTMSLQRACTARLSHRMCFYRWKQR